MSKKIKPDEKFLIIPYCILNLPGLSLPEKCLLARIHSFKAKGCYESNQRLAEVFMVSVPTVKRWMQKVLRSGQVYVKSGKGYYRTIWSKLHPEVQQATKLWYRKHEIPKVDCIKSGPVNRTKDIASTGSDSSHNRLKSEPGTGSKPDIRLERKRATINNMDKKKTIKGTAPPSPLLARGQAQAVLKQRQEQQQVSTKKFMTNFGKDVEICPIEERIKIRKKLSKIYPVLAAIG